MAVHYALDKKLPIYVDWSDEMWSHNGETFYSYFDLKMPSFVIEDVSSLKVYPSFWKNNLKQPLTQKVIDENPELKLPMLSNNDFDCDVLVYSFCDPYSGADNITPAPDPPSNPPYGTVSWSAGFGPNNQITSNPQMTINASTGQITGTPTQFGQFVIGVKVSEYRNGVYIGETRRDFQFNILPCNNAIASIPAQQSFCTGLSVYFDNTSVNSTNYIWDFGDLSTNTDTSSQQTFTYTYPSPGSYTVSLIAYNPAGNCYDTAYSTFQVSPLLSPTYTPPAAQCLDNNSYNFLLGGSIDPSANYSWDFGQFAIPQSSSSPNPT
jgi:hypothetical protein